MFYIYRITNLLNQKTYIGKRKSKNPIEDSYMGSGVILSLAKNKYGIENFKKDIIVKDISTKEQINILEKHHINFAGNNASLYIGGDGGSIGIQAKNAIGAPNDFSSLFLDNVNGLKLIKPLTPVGTNKGISSNRYFGANYDNNTYVQKKYVDNLVNYSQDVTIKGKWINGFNIYTQTKITTEPVPENMGIEFPRVTIAEWTIYTWVDEPPVI